MDSYNSIDWEKVIDRIDQLQKQHGLSNRKLAEIVGISSAAISRFKAGYNRMSVDSLARVGKAFDTTIDGLLHDEFQSPNEHFTLDTSSRIEDLNRVERSETASDLNPPKNKVFISYSHRDKTYLDRLQVHLKPLQNLGIIDVWDDTRIKMGDDWKASIEHELQSAAAAILLVSADFLASDFILSNELPALLNNAKNAGTRIFPVILKPCRFERDEKLCMFQAANQEPIGFLSEIERERMYDDIAFNIEKAFKA